MEGSANCRWHLCPAGHELRITRRCLEEDLDADPEDCDFEALRQSHQIVHAFRAQRSASTGGGGSVGPEAGEMTIRPLRRGNDHRGATWYDEESGIVWLLASGFHRSGQADDAFRYFMELIRDGRIYPDEDDYEDMASDRSDQFVDRARLGVPALLDEAQAKPGKEVSAEIGLESVSCVVHVVETAEERFFSVSGMVGPPGLELLKALFAPDREHQDWRSEPKLPTRDLDFTRAEMCFSAMIC